MAELDDTVSFPWRIVTKRVDIAWNTPCVSNKRDNNNNNLIFPEDFLGLKEIQIEEFYHFVLTFFFLWNLGNFVLRVK